MIIAKSAQSILSIILMISTGYILTARGWFDENSSELLVKLVVKLSFPLMLIQNIMSNFNKDNLLNASRGLIVPFLSMTLCYLMGAAFSRILKVKKERQGVFKLMFFTSNTIYMGLPVNIALFGEKSLPYALLYYIANTIFFWTLGIYIIDQNGSQKYYKIFSVESIKRIFSPSLTAFFLATVLILLNIKLPPFLMDTFKYMGNLTTPLSMLFIGITIRSIDLKQVRFDRDMAGVLFGRFFVSPLTILLISLAFPLPKLMRDVFIIQASMPVMTNTAIITRAYNTDYEYAAIMVTITTIVSVLIIPFYMLLLNNI
ncbi:AEC family transporter [Thermoanaerobacterium sp. DL9XJH110]|uniref:AEC family transporter n=1 Tax=Thermoanaerobacterium sp. DL9XJH110 TaxID=3386643 RepID=UPI003BB5DDBC